MLKSKNPSLWWLINLFGINLIPTVLVFLGLVPVHYLIKNGSELSLYTVIGFILCIVAAITQLISDMQMNKHRKHSNSRLISAGLWKYSRHPNYFGEVLFWWGLFVMSNNTSDLLLWRMTGALLITSLFVFISIPMMESHLQDRFTEYSDYKDKVSMLLPWFQKN